MKPIERLAVYCKLHKIHYSTIEDRVNIAKGYLSRQIKSQASIGSDILERIFVAFPEINPTWFFTGKGEPYLTEKEIERENSGGSSDSLVAESGGHTEIYRQQIDSLSWHIELLKKEIVILNSTIAILRGKVVK
jgi:hypothetical protein